MKIRATLHAMAENEILSILPHGEYLRIKAMDPKPLFRAYVIGHEGMSHPTALGIGKIAIGWFERTIRKLRDQIQLGTKLFHGHAQSNVHDNRTSVGEIVGTALKTIKDKLSVIAIAYIRQPYRDLKLDVASIEADVILSINEETGETDAEVKDITGIALGDSSEDAPAFAGATLIGEMQAFLTKSQYTKGGDMGLTSSEVRDFIRTEKLNPSDLFGIEELRKDPLIISHIESETKGQKTDEWWARKRENEDRERKDKERETDQKTKDDALKKERDDALKLAAAGQIPVLVKKIKEERKLDENQIVFIDRAVKKFSSTEKIEDLEKDLNSFFDEQIKEYREIGEEVFGVKKKDPDPKKGNGDGSGGEEQLSDSMEDMSLDEE